MQHIAFHGSEENTDAMGFRLKTHDPLFIN